MEAEAPEIYVIGPPHAQGLIESLAQAAQLPLDVVDHQRLAPLEVAKRPWTLQSLPPRTIVVAFSRSMVLRLKTELENYRRNVSVVYGNLPPEVRRKQADRFAEGTTEICVATDAVGMGLNLPADRVCFFELSKFDGRENRVLTPSEVHQIAGRAGRYGLSTAGEVGATTNRDLKTLRGLYAQPSEFLTHARVAPDVEDLELLPGSLSRRFAQWRELQSIPDSLRNVIRPADIDERIALAQMLSDREVEQLGLATAVQLVNAPTRETSRTYWHTCARSILKAEPMPLPPEAPWVIENNHDLDSTEASIACADIYLWLACRPEFSAYGKEEPKVREVRLAWSMSIDAALVRRVDTAARCISCHRKLPLNHRFTLCDECFHSRGSYWYR
jgi:ATP-dependent RNA helicase SUPV3L1/SUV3